VFGLEKLDVSVIFDINSFTFLNDNTILFSLKGGDLYNLQILNEKSLKLTKLNDLMLEASCMTSIKEMEMVFMGSKLSDSLLLQYKEKKNIETEKTQKMKELIDNEESLKNIYDVDDTDINNDDDDDIIMYDEEEEDEKPKKKQKLGTSSIEFFEFLEQDFKENFETQYIDYEYDVLDSLFTVGPFSSFDVGKYKKHKIITTSGQLKDGSIVVLEKSIKPVNYVSQKLDFENIYKLFTFKLTENEYDSYVVISEMDSSKLLKVGDGLNEITDSKLILKEQTINIGYFNKKIIQILKSKIRVMKNINTLIEDIELDREIYYSKILNGLMLLHFTDGLISIVLPNLKNIFPKFKYLYGKILSSFLYFNQKEKLFYLVLYWSSGVLEIYSINNSFENDELEMESIFVYVNFSNLSGYMLNQDLSSEENEEFINANSKKVQYPFVNEILLKEFDGYLNIFFIMSDGNLVIYKEFQKLCFSKVHHNFIYRSLKNVQKYQKFQKKEDLDDENDEKNDENIKQIVLESSNIFTKPLNSILIPFNNISNHQGILFKI
jgi:hypothetical protein